MQIAENVFCYPWRGQGNNCNSYALKYEVDGAARYALVDPGLSSVPVPISNGRAIVNMMQEPGLNALLASLRQDGISPEEEVGLVIATHGHADHCESSLWWKEQHGAVVALHEADRDLYTKAVRGNKQRQATQSLDDQPDVFLEEGELRLGYPKHHSLQIFHTPGHSAGSVSIYWPEVKVLIAGDVIFYRSVGRTDFPGGSAAKLREGIRRLSELAVDHLLTGHAYGHPGIISGREAIEANFNFILSYVLR